MLTKEQLAKRKHGIYASEIAAIVGLSPWKTPGEVWVEKTGLGLDGELSEEEEQEERPSEDIERGVYLERAIIDWTAARTGEIIRPNSGPDGVSDVTYQHPRIPWAHATPDGIIYRDDAIDGVVEVKAPSWRTAQEWDDPEEIPDGAPVQYLCQVQWQMECAGARRAIIGALVDGRLRVYHLTHSEKLANVLLEKAGEFWDSVQAGRPPKVQSASDSAWLSRLYRKDVGEIYDVTGDDDALYGGLARDYAIAGAREKEAKDEKAKCKALLQEFLGERPGIRGGDWKVLWKCPKDRETTDWQSIAIAAGASEELIKQFTKRVPSTRRFTVYAK